jgi:hypothetical protein
LHDSVSGRLISDITSAIEEAAIDVDVGTHITYGSFAAL